MKLNASALFPLNFSLMSWHESSASVSLFGRLPARDPMSAAVRWMLPYAAESSHYRDDAQLPGRRSFHAVVFGADSVPSGVRLSAGRLLSDVVPHRPESHRFLRTKRRMRQSAGHVQPAHQLLLSATSTHAARVLQRPDCFHHLHSRSSVRCGHGMLQRRLLSYAFLSVRSASEQSLRPRRRLPRQLHLPGRSLLSSSSMPQRRPGSAHLHILQ
jgi:hypothetical protein